MKQSKELQVAILAAKESGKILKRYFGKSVKFYHKDKETVDYVTEVDLSVQKKIVDIISKNFPDHGFLAEEKDLSLKKKYRWVIDPIDGTFNFMQGLTLFATCIGLEKDGEIILGVISNPVTNELYWAQKGKGAYKNGKKISVSKNKNFRDAMIAFSFGKTLKSRIDVLSVVDNIKNDFKSLLCLQSCSVSFVAEGKIDILFDNGDYWDFAAGKIIIEEAGGVVTGWRGEKYNGGRSYILVANKYLHKEMLDRIKKVFK